MMSGKSAHHHQMWASSQPLARDGRGRGGMQPDPDGDGDPKFI